MRRWNPEIGTMVEHIKTGERAIVSNRSEHWGWYEVEYKNGNKRIHNVTGGNTKQVWREVDFEKDLEEALAEVRAIQRADKLLKLENAGITDNWHEY